MNERNFDKKFKIYFKNIKFLIHIGAYVPKSSVEKTKNNYIKKVNIYSTNELAKWSKKNNIHFIFISGSAIYKKDKKNFEKSKIFNFSKNAYINSKIKSEKKILKLKNNKKFIYTILRPSSIYGIGLNKNKIIYKYFKELKLNKKLTIYDYENTSVNFIHAKDVARAIYLCLIYKKKGIFNLGSKSCNNFYDLTKIFKKIIKSKSKIELIKTNRPRLLRSLDVDIRKSIEELNWSPNIKLKKGLKMFVEKKWI